jgi:hypothetical protein
MYAESEFAKKKKEKPCASIVMKKQSTSLSGWKFNLVEIS